MEPAFSRLGTLAGCIRLAAVCEEEAALLARENLGTVFMGERELARAMAERVLTRCDAASDEATAASQ